MLQSGGDWEAVNLNLDGFTDEFRPLVVAGDFIYVLAQRMGAIDSDNHLLRYRISDKSWSDIHNIGFSTLADFEVNDEGKDVDPYVQTLVRKVALMRRTVDKFPEKQEDLCG